ncbi:MAG: hypothetical protein AAF823_12150, partial [Planctomycetota bacterium]
MQGRVAGPRCAVGLSESGVAADAAGEVMDRLGEVMAGWGSGGGGSGRADLVVVWATLDHGPELADICERVAEGTAAKHVVGATWQGVGAGRRGVETGPGLAVWAADLGG